MVLSKYDIQRYIREHNLIEVPVESNIQTSSYDLRFSGEYYCYHESHKNRVVIETTNVLRIPPDAVCFIISEETLNMPNNLMGDISLNFGLIKQGVMLSRQPPIDAGYHGKIVGMLHNLSDDAVQINKGSHVLNIVFYELATPLEAQDLYSGKYQGLSTLKDYCSNVTVGALSKLSQEVHSKKEKLFDCIPNMLVIITILIGVLTVTFAIVSAILLFLK